MTLTKAIAAHLIVGVLTAGVSHAETGAAKVKELTRRLASARTLQGTLETTATTQFRGARLARKSSVRFSLKSPNLGYAEIVSDDPTLDSVRMVCDGKKLYLLSVRTKQYAVSSAPKSLMGTALVLPGGVGDFAHALQRPKAKYLPVTSAVYRGHRVDVVSAVFELPVSPGQPASASRLTLTLYLNKRDGLPLMVEQTALFKESKLVIRSEFRALKMNGAVDAGVFVWKAPAGATEVGPER